MRTAIRLLFALLLWSPAFAQSDDIREIETTQYFAAYRTASLSAAAETVTIHQSGTAVSVRKAYLDAASIYCSVPCVVTLERSGAAPTTTELTPVALNNWGSGVTPSTTVKVYHTSNVGAGTAVAAYPVPADSTLVLDLHGMVLAGGTSTTRNVTLKTDSITGVVRLVLKWRER